MWEWEYSSNPRQWTATVGEWRGIACRTEGPRYAWQSYVERVTTPHDRHTGPTFKDAVDARTWCLRQIATFRANAEIEK